MLAVGASVTAQVFALARPIGNGRVTRGPTIEDLCLEFLARGRAKNLSPRTIEWYERHARAFARWCASEGIVLARELQCAHLDDFLVALHGTGAAATPSGVPRRPSRPCHGSDSGRATSRPRSRGTPNGSTSRALAIELVDPIFLRLGQALRDSLQHLILSHQMLGGRPGHPWRCGAVVSKPGSPVRH